MYNINMPLTVKLPEKKKKEEYSLYVNAKITYKKTFDELGTLIISEGSGIAFYSASNSRRAIVFSEITDTSSPLPLLEGNLPYFKEKVKIIYKAKGRKIDLLKFMVYNLEKRYGKEIYILGEIYWLTVASFIDSLKPHAKQPVSYKRQIYMITDKYLKKGKRNEDL